MENTNNGNNGNNVEPKFSLLLTRKFRQQRSQENGVAYIIKRSVSGARKNWNCRFAELPESGKINSDGFYVYQYRLDFEKTAGRRDDNALLVREREAILKAVDDAATLSRFQPFAWKTDSNISALVVEETEKGSRTKHALSANVEIDRAELKRRILDVINPILSGEKSLADCEYFAGIFERDAQIRTLLSSVKSFLDTDGKRRNHVLLFGMPACAKTQILNCFAKLVGDAAITRLDGTSTTPAGIYKVYFDEYDEMDEPPFVILEECEKTSEESLRVWLGVMDDRGELRKVNAREMRTRELKVLCLATANDKNQFDALMGGTGTDQPGALSSRFAHQLHCPRPNEKVLRLILSRDIQENGGKQEWIDAVIKLANDLHTDDPRKVLSLLDGQDRLLDGSYAADLMSMYKQTVGELTLRNRQGLA